MSTCIGEFDTRCQCAGCGAWFEPYDDDQVGLCPTCDLQVSARRIDGQAGPVAPIFTCLFCNKQGPDLKIYRVSNGRLGICGPCAEKALVHVALM